MWIMWCLLNNIMFTYLVWCLWLFLMSNTCTVSTRTCCDIVMYKHELDNTVYTHNYIHIILYILFVWYIFVLERFNDWSGSEPSQSSTRVTGSETLKRCFNFDPPPLRTPPSWKVKTNMEPKNEGLEDDFPFKVFRFHVSFGGVHSTSFKSFIPWK